MRIHEGLGFNENTGEAIAVWYEQDADGNDTKAIRKIMPTGWFFEDVRQVQPVLDGPNIIGTSNAAIAPWNFPTLTSIYRLIKLLGDRGIKVDGFQYLDQNQQFPYTHRVSRILLNLDGQVAQLDAGQIIRYFCARTNEFGVQEVDAVIREQIEELRNQRTRFQAE